MWVLLIIAIVLIYIYIKNAYQYWEKRGLHTPKFHYIVGNLLEQFMFKKNSAIIMQDCYNAFEGYNYIGFYNALQPAILVRNPEVIGDILVKDFASFHDNDFDIDENDDPAFGKNPFIQKGEKWKRARAQATPSFTTGKTKIMFPLIEETCTKLTTYLNNHQTTPLELFPLSLKMTADNVASCAFGLEGHSFTKDGAEFIEICHQLINPTPWNILKGFMIFLCPSLARIVKVRFFQKETTAYLQNIVQETMKYRAEHNIQRNDFLDEMKRLKEKINDEQIFNNSDILGHAGGFLLDGMLTSASVIAYLIFSVANDDEVQRKLREEITDILHNNNDQLTFENIQEMTYLDQVLKESIRQNPPLMYMTRRVTKPYKMQPMRQDGSGPRVELEVGTPVIIPTFALHRDEKHFQNADHFDPERFNADHKTNIVRYSYLPFSDGPRVCLGKKFGVLQTKMLLITILRGFNLRVNEKTEQPLEVDPTSFLNLPVGGHWVEFTKL